MDTPGLLNCLNTQWPNPRLHEVLLCGDEDAAKVALTCLTLTGDGPDIPHIAQKLGDDDPSVARFAEYAMWTIWFRAGGADAESRLNQAVRLLSQNDLDTARELLLGIASDHPDYAEAINQLAIACFLKGDYEASIQYCERVLQLEPYHFGAVAGLGHCYAATGQLESAMKAYRRALRIHPRLEGIHRTLLAVRKAMRAGKVSIRPTTPVYAPGPGLAAPAVGPTHDTKLP